MAVYTKLKKENIKEILSNYSIGQLEKFKGIEDGIENTNYFLLVSNKKYILTIYEKRVKEKDLPFFSNLMTGLDKENFKCPAPIKNKNNGTIFNYPWTTFRPGWWCGNHKVHVSDLTRRQYRNDRALGKSCDESSR